MENSEITNQLNALGQIFKEQSISDYSYEINRLIEK